jgi:UDP-N-acetyl-D-glucosamine dehydrogenase
MDIDLWDVIRCASSKPFGFQAFYPGPGVGGHCIPIDPNYLSYKVRTQLGHQFRFVELAQEINQSMPAYVVRRVQDALNTVGKAVNGASVLILGVTYKADIADQRESPARPIGLKLRQLGATLTYHDPYAETWSIDGEVLRCVPSLEEALAAADITVVLQHHSDYDADVILARARYVLDTRGQLPDAANLEHL